MRKKTKSRFTIQKAFSFMPPLAQFIEERSKAVGLSQSGYVQKLVEYDKSANVIADAMRAEADRVSAVA